MFLKQDGTVLATGHNRDRQLGVQASDKMDSACFVPSDAYPLIEEHFATHIVDSQLIKSAITFAKKICSSAATASSIYSAKEKYYTEMEDQLRVEYPATSFESDLPFEDWMDFYPAVRN